MYAAGTREPKRRWRLILTAKWPILGMGKHRVMMLCGKGGGVIRAKCQDKVQSTLAADSLISRLLLLQEE